MKRFALGCEILLRLLVIELALRTISFRRLILFLGHGHAHLSFDTPATLLPHTHRIANGLARRLRLQNICLKTSMVLYWMAPGKTVIHLGLLRGQTIFEAHAWVESDGQVFSLRDPSEFARLMEFAKPV